MILGTVSAQSLSDILDKIDSPKVDIAPLLGLNSPLHVGVEDVHDLLKSGEPTLRLEYQGSVLTVHREGGGLMAMIKVNF